MKINNIILVLRTRIILLSSFVIYFFCICHSGRFPILLTDNGLLGVVSKAVDKSTNNKAVGSPLDNDK